MVALVALGIGSFTAFSTSATSLDESLMLANIEALADMDDDGNIQSTGRPKYVSCKITVNVGHGGAETQWGTRSTCRGSRGGTCYEGPCRRII